MPHPMTEDTPTFGRFMNDREREEALKYAQEFKNQHSELFERLADNEGHSVIAIHHPEAPAEKYRDLFIMHPTARMRPNRAVKKAEELIIEGKNVYTARPIVLQQGRLTAVNKDLRVELIDHKEDGTPSHLTLDENGDTDKPIISGFNDVRTDIARSIFRHTYKQELECKDD